MCFIYVKLMKCKAQSIDQRNSSSQHHFSFTLFPQHSFLSAPLSPLTSSPLTFSPLPPLVLANKELSLLDYKGRRSDMSYKAHVPHQGLRITNKGYSTCV